MHLDESQRLNQTLAREMEDPVRFRADKDLSRLFLGFASPHDPLYFHLGSK